MHLLKLCSASAGDKIKNELTADTYMQSPGSQRLYKPGDASLSRPFSKKLMDRLTGRLAASRLFRTALQSLAGRRGTAGPCRKAQQQQGMKLWDTEVELLPFISEAAPPSTEWGEADGAQAGAFRASFGALVPQTA